MTNISEALMPGKFLLCISQLLMTTNIFYTYEDNVLSSVGSDVKSGDDDFEQAKWSILICAMLGVASQVFELLVLFTGRPLFFEKINVFEILLHGIGVLLICWFIFYDWTAGTLWAIWSLTSLVPLVLDITILVSAGKLYKDN